jgi:tetratricopeptide (TPR) repeat protein
MKNTLIRPIAMLFLTAILTVAFTNSATAQSENSNAAAKANFERGSKLYDEEKFAEAVLAYKEVVRAAPNSPSGYMGLGMSYLMQKQWSEAEQNLQRAVELLSASAAASSGEVLEEMQAALKFAREQTAKQKPPAINPQAEALFKQGNEFFNAKQWKKAIKVWEEAAKLAPDQASIFYNLGSAYFNSKQYTKARNAYREALRLNPNHPSAAADLADAEAKMKEEKAEQAAFMAKLNNAIAETGENLSRSSGSGSENSTSNSGNTGSSSSPPTGSYPCYYFGYNYALTSSSLTEISILNNQKMKIVGETVGFSFENSILTLLEGEFRGATARYKLDSDGKPAIVFNRKENEAKGHKIDVSDTWCYLEK